MYRLDGIRPNTNIGNPNYISAHLNVFDACTQLIDFTDFKEKSEYLNIYWFLKCKEINEFNGAGKNIQRSRNQFMSSQNSEINNFTVNDTGKSIIAWKRFI